MPNQSAIPLSDNIAVQTAAPPSAATLGSEIQQFLDSLPEWAKLFCDIILSGRRLDDDKLQEAYQLFLADAELVTHTARSAIVLNFSSYPISSYKQDLQLHRIHGVEGVNALSESQIMEFGPNVTVFFGVNGSGKSGYTRLLKDAFFNRFKEEILPNVNVSSGHKPIKAEFIFKTNGSEYSRSFPNDRSKPEFQQFAVFDNKCAPVHLDERNHFVFRPQGLSLFGELVECYKRLQHKLDNDYNTRVASSDFVNMFDGDSIIKEKVRSITHQSNLDELRGLGTFTVVDDQLLESKMGESEQVRAQHINRTNELSRKREEIAAFANLKNNFVSFATWFTEPWISNLNSQIQDYNNKRQAVYEHRTRLFESLPFQHVGGPAWKAFIEVAHVFSEQQTVKYPNDQSNCIFCNQKLDDAAVQLIERYWTVIASELEIQLNNAKRNLETLVGNYRGLTYDLLPIGSIVHNWLNSNDQPLLTYLQQSLQFFQGVSENIIANIERGELITIDWNVISLEGIDNTLASMDQAILGMTEPTDPRIDQLRNEIDLLRHKRTLMQLIPAIEQAFGNLQWRTKADQARNSLTFRWITETEKRLSDQFFNSSYYESFSRECGRLNGDFGVGIVHTGNQGASYRQLKLHDRPPSDILSEGEQKVVALADFLSELSMSTINRGIIFDDPVTSLDSDRKKCIARRLIEESRTRQVVIFTHDLVFYNYLFNASKELLDGYDRCFIHHTIKKNNQSEIGLIVPNYSPVHQSLYQNSSLAKDFLEKSRASNGREQLTNIKSGYGALRSSYEYLISHKITAAVIQRFDPQIRVGRLNQVKYDPALIERIISEHGEISDFIDAHLPADEIGIIPTPDTLNLRIVAFDTIQAQINALR